MAASSGGRRRPVLVLAFCLTAIAVAGAQRQTERAPAADDKTIVHVLNRIGYGPTLASFAEAKRVGLDAYIAAQLQPERVKDEALEARLAAFTTLKMSTAELAEQYYLPAMMERRERQRAAAANPDMRPPADPPMRENSAGGRSDERRAMLELTEQKLLRAIYSERQLEEVMVDFWFNHFNVFAGKGPTRMYLLSYERDAIRPRVFGKFRDLLGAIAESPAMLFYLDNSQNSAPRSDVEEQMRAGRRRPMPAEQRPNRTRGINENYARELMELHTMGVDGGYTQKDVQEVARAFTGWTIDQPRRGGSFRFEPRMHDNGEKKVLGMTLARGGGKADGEKVLDLLAKHPSTARFISTKLARRFISDEPPASVVDRATARFTETGGDIREVVRTILTSREFYAKDTIRAKVKTPLEFVASAVRVSGADLRTAAPLAQTLRSLGMPLYMCQPPTGYADKAEAWVNTGALVNRMNFAVTLSSTGQQRRAGSVTPLTSEDVIAAQLMANDLSEQTRTTVARATNEPQKLALLLGSPDFQRR